MRVLLNPKDPMRQIRKPAPGQQVILDVYKATSGAASTSVVNLKYALEVAQTKLL